MNDKPTTYLQIKTHKLTGYFVKIERKATDSDLGTRYIPQKINLTFQNSYYNDVGTHPESKITETRAVTYEYGSGSIIETRWIGDKFTSGNTGMIDIPSFSIIFYNLETKIREILRINKILNQRKIEKKYNKRLISYEDRILLKKNDENLSKFKRTYIKELIGICKEHLFLIEDRFENKEYDVEIIENEKEMVVN